MSAHRLVAIDAETAECSCGDWSGQGSFQSHLARVAPFQGTPSAVDIAHWYVETKRDEPNVGGDAWLLARDPHSSCRRLALIDMDTQHWVLLDIATGDMKDLLLVSHGLVGLWAEWWQHPVSTTSTDPYRERDGIAWLADQIVVSREYAETP